MSFMGCIVQGGLQHGGFAQGEIDMEYKFICEHCSNTQKLIAVDDDTALQAIRTVFKWQVTEEATLVRCPKCFSMRTLGELIYMEASHNILHATEQTRRTATLSYIRELAKDRMMQEILQQQEMQNLFGGPVGEA